MMNCCCDSQPTMLGGLMGDVGDEIIAGARLQWSTSADLNSDTYSWTDWEADVFQVAAGRLRNAMEQQPDLFQQIQFGTLSWDSWTPSRDYRGTLVVEFTSPITRHLRNDVRRDLERLAIAAGLTIDPNPAHNNIRIVSQGGGAGGGGAGGGDAGGAPAEPGLPTTTPKPPSNTPPPSGPGFFDQIAVDLGINKTEAQIVLLGGAAMVVILLMKKP